MADYVRWLREKVGHEPVFLNAVGGIIVNDAGEVLLQRRGGGEKENSWGLPGGVMEIGENPHETLKREVREETGFDVEADRFLGVYTGPGLVRYPNGDVCQMMTQMFSCRVVGGEMKADGDETLELKYFNKENRPTLFRPHLEKALKDFEAGIFGNSAWA